MSLSPVQLYAPKRRTGAPITFAGILCLIGGTTMAAYNYFLQDINRKSNEIAGTKLTGGNENNSKRI